MSGYRTCDAVVSRDCKLSSTRTECFACGLSACTACSVRISYFSYGRQRICYPCIEGGMLEDSKVISRVAGALFVSAIRNTREGLLSPTAALAAAARVTFQATLFDLGWAAEKLADITEVKLRS